MVRIASDFFGADRLSLIFNGPQSQSHVAGLGGNILRDGIKMADLHVKFSLSSGIQSYLAQI